MKKTVVVLFAVSFLLGAGNAGAQTAKQLEQGKVLNLSEEYTRDELNEMNGSRLGNSPDESFFPWENIAQVHASSELEQKYGAGNLTDRTWESWAEGAAGNGIGESFTVEFKLPVKLNGFYLRNGYGQADYYFRNNRIKSLEIVYNDTVNGGTLEVEDSFYEMRYSVPGTERQGDFVECTKITFIIKDVYPGTEYDDTCITEILFSAPELRSARFWIENEATDRAERFRADRYTVSLLKAMYEGYGVQTRINSDGELEIYEMPSFAADDYEWFKPELGLSGEVAHMYFSGTGAGQEGHRYKIFLSPDFPPLMIIYKWSTTSLFYLENELYKIQLFNGTSWEDRNGEPAVMSVLAFKKDMEDRGLMCYFSFEDSSSGVVFSKRNSLILEATEIVIDNDLPHLNIMETYRLIWNGEKFELQ
jgi:hypothetical protein